MINVFSYGVKLIIAWSFREGEIPGPRKQGIRIGGIAPNHPVLAMRAASVIPGVKHDDVNHPSILIHGIWFGGVLEEDCISRGG